MKRIVLLITFLVFAGVPVFAADVATMDKDELKNLLGSENLVLLDVRTGGDWGSSEYKIEGAVRVDPSDVPSWATTYPKDKTYVIYCS